MFRNVSIIIIFPQLIHRNEPIEYAYGWNLFYDSSF